MNYKLNGKRLRDARRYRQLSISELAEKVDVSKQMISRYERDEAVPGLDVFQKIIQVLKFPLKYFTESDNFSITDEGTFYRSRMTATQSEKQPSEMYKKAVAIIRDYFGEYIEFPEPNISRDGDKTPSLAAISLRKSWNLGESPIANVMHLLESHGMVVSIIDSGSKKIDAHSGYESINGHKYYVILLDQNSPTFYRQQFNLAHELGHFILHAEIFNPQELDHEDYAQIENEANEFASEFLLPAVAFKKSIGNHASDLKQYLFLKDTWHVSIASMIYRAHHIGLLSPADYTKLQRKISYRGWRKSEPMDDVAQPSNPQLLKQAFELLTKNDIFEPVNLSTILGEKYGTPYPNEMLAQIIGIDPSEFNGQIIHLKQK